jgi:hypothetical protein
MSMLHPKGKAGEAFVNAKYPEMICKIRPHYTITMLKAC